jgi:hypothetical protein
VFFQGVIVNIVYKEKSTGAGNEITSLLEINLILNAVGTWHCVFFGSLDIDFFKLYFSLVLN